MAEFKFNCPQCGQEIEADEAYRGQMAACPYCGKGIVVPRIAPENSTSLPNSFDAIGKRYNQPSVDQPSKYSNCKLIACIAIGVACLLVVMSVGFIGGQEKIRRSNQRKIELYHNAISKLDCGYSLTTDEAVIMRKVKDLEYRYNRAMEKMQNGLSLSAGDLAAIGEWTTWKAAEDPSSGFRDQHEAFKRAMGDGQKVYPILE